MKRSFNRKPQPTTNLGGTAIKAWWYENDKSIDVVIETKEGGTGMARIPRKWLADWLARTE